MTNEAAKIGDVMVLNSGGPDMTVIEVSGDNITTRWANEQGFQVDTFHKATIKNKHELAKAPAPPAPAASPAPKKR